MTKRLFIGLLSGALALTLVVPGAAMAKKDAAKDACKKGGWADLIDANGRTFPDQGACVGYIAESGGNGSGGFLLAIAYSNLNGRDGFQAGSTDVMIAKLIDTDGNGLDEGDRVRMGHYPTSWAATAFADWGVKTHEVKRIVRNRVDQLSFYNTQDCYHEWADFADSEGYTEYECPDGWVMIDDFHKSNSIEFIDVRPRTASQPIAAVDLRRELASDDRHIDVDIFYR